MVFIYSYLNDMGFISLVAAIIFSWPLVSYIRGLSKVRMIVGTTIGALVLVVFYLLIGLIVGGSFNLHIARLDLFVSKAFVFLIPLLIITLVAAIASKLQNLKGFPRTKSFVGFGILIGVVHAIIAITIFHIYFPTALGGSSCLIEDLGYQDCSQYYWWWTTPAIIIIGSLGYLFLPVLSCVKGIMSRRDKEVFLFLLAMGFITLLVSAIILFGYDGSCSSGCSFWEIWNRL
tara:strand:- start:654 stop:1349 length:696 start_codon:yes stop_codon:yes gene_type:complete